MTDTTSSVPTTRVRAQTALPATRSRSKRRALVVDDSEAARVILKRLLEREDVEVVISESGDDALERVRLDRLGFGLIVMDLVMDCGGGIETIRRIRQLPDAAGCVICPTSSSASAALEEECQAAGASMQILRKPYSPSSITGMVQEVFGPAAAPPAAPSGRKSVRFGQDSNESVGVDAEGALERCCDDVQLLREMLEAVSQSGFERIRGVQASLRKGNLAGASLQLHNLRGDLLNLGMIGLAARLHGVEESIRNRPALPATVGDDLQQAHVVDESVHKRLVHIALDIASTASSMCQLPLMQRRIKIVPTPEQTDHPLDPQEFAALIAAMSRQEVSAFAMAPEGKRLLPADYAQDIESEFRSHFESLDFPAALRLVRPADHPDEPVQVVNGGHRLLIVDDSPSTIRLLSTILQNAGTLRFALSGEQALELALAWMPALVLTDVRMDGMSGIELCRRLKELPETSNAAVVVLSADKEIANEVSALSAGAADFIEKPLNPSRVVARVNAQLANLDRMRISQEAMIGESRQLPIGFITCSFSGRIIEMNPSVAKLIGRPTQSFSGQHLHTLFEPSRAGTVSGALESLAATGKPISLEASLAVTASEAIAVRIVGWSAPGVGGRVLWISIEDLRDWRLAERKRLDMRMSSQIASITGGIAHEFNNLLNIILGNLDLALEGETDAGRRRRLDAASKAAERAAEISRRLGDSVRTAAMSTRQPVGLNKLVDELWPLVANSVPRRVRVVKEIAPDLPSVLVEPRLFRDAVFNLIQNAYDAMPSGGRVVLSVRTEPSGAATLAVVEVRDEGVGMAQDVAEKAFDPFFTTRAPDHAGLGLTMVRNMVADLGGTVHIRSAPGKGTVVTLRLPAAVAAPDSGGNVSSAYGGATANEDFER